MCTSTHTNDGCEITRYLAGLYGPVTTGVEAGVPTSTSIPTVSCLDMACRDEADSAMRPF